MSQPVPNLVARVARVPEGLPCAEDFVIAQEPIPTPGAGEVLFRAIYMSLDPAMRRKMPQPAGAPVPVGGTAMVGGPMIAGEVPPRRGTSGGFVGVVVESRDPAFAPGDLVHGGVYWQTYQVVPAHALDKVPAGANLRHELGMLGQPGFVAWCGMRLVGKPRAGETVVVSAAGGAIGMVAGQLAKASGARVIGIASGDKVAYVVDELGFDACIDRTAEDVGAALDRLCPAGIDVYFENVGGAVGAAAYDRMRDFGRFVVCGMAGEYNAPETPFARSLRPVLRKRLTIQGYIVWDHYDRFDEFRAEMTGLVAAGRMHYREQVVQGFRNAPAALADLLTGRNAGKVMVQLGPEPQR